MSGGSHGRRAPQGVTLVEAYGVRNAHAVGRRKRTSVAKGGAQDAETFVLASIVGHIFKDESIVCAPIVRSSVSLSLS